jgi:hypothetical protein
MQAVMRTTLAIDDDVLAAARALAAVQRRTVGETLSDLARRALQQSTAPAERNGVPLLPVSNPTARITLDLVNELRDAPQ